MHLRALVVDDSPIVQKIHKLFLEQAGCIVDVAACGEQALALLENNYQIIFMDIHMPDMTGFEVTAEIRRREGELKHTPIIGITAMANAVNNYGLPGLDEMIEKPISVHKIAELLQRWISN